MMRGSEKEARELADEARERGIEARACLDARFGWVVRARTPFHEGDVVLRNFSELMDVLSEAAGWA
jgi:hypothetical protein